MSDKKISELTSLTGANAADGDFLPIVDVSANETKKMTRQELFTSIPSVDINGGTIDGTVIGETTPAAVSGTTGQFGTSLNVDGTVTADGLTVDGDTSTFNSVSATAVILQRGGGSDSNVAIHFNQTTADTYLGADGGNSFVVGRALNLGISRTAKFDQNGDISFYEDTGTTPKFFWGASAEALGIGTSSPNAASIVDAQSTTKGVRFPNMTTTQKNAIANVAGNVVFDTTLGKLCVNSGSGWETITSI